MSLHGFIVNGVHRHWICLICELLCCCCYRPSLCNAPIVRISKMPNGKVKLFRYVAGWLFLRLRCICHSANKKMTNDLCNIQSNAIKDIFTQHVHARIHHGIDKTLRYLS